MKPYSIRKLEWFGNLDFSEILTKIQFHAENKGEKKDNSGYSAVVKFTKKMRFTPCLTPCP